MSFDVRRIPFLGGGLANIGQVYDTLSSDCDVDALVWIQAGFSALPGLALSLAKPEIVDVDLVRGKRHHKKKRHLKFKFSQILQPTIEIRGAPGWYAFAFNNIERFGWYLLVFDATTDFVVNWTSMAYRWSGCVVPEQAHCRNWNPFAVWENGRRWPITLDFRSSNHRGIESNINSLYVSEGITASFTCAVKPHEQSIPPGDLHCSSITTEIVRSSDQKVLVRHEKRYDGTDNGSSGGVFKDWRQSDAEGNYQLYVTTQGTGSHCIVNMQDFSAYGQSLGGLQPDP